MQYQQQQRAMQIKRLKVAVYLKKISKDCA